MNRTIDVLAPCRHPDEVDPLIDAGATALYCGVADATWLRRWGHAISPNRRGPSGNLPHRAALAAVCRFAALREVPVYLALNAPMLDDARHRAVVELARWGVSEAGVRGVIVADVGLLADVARCVEGAEVVASTVATARNSAAVALLRDLGARRVILSRQLDLSEIRAIRDAVTDVVLEAFVLNDACVFEEGCCATTHSLSGFHDVYCVTPWQHDGDIPAPDTDRDRHRAHVAAMTLQAYSVSRRLPLGPCGLCAVGELLAAGVDGLKIVGREADPYRKVRSVQMVRHVLDGVAVGGVDEARRRAVTLRADPEGCRGGLACLYPEARPWATGPQTA